MFWVQIALFKHIELYLGHFFQTQPTLIGNPYDSCQMGSERLRKNIVGLMSYLEKSLIPIHRQLSDQDGVRGVCCTLVEQLIHGHSPVASFPQTIESNWRCGRHNLQRIQCRSENSKGVYCLQYDDEKIISGLRDNSIKVSGCAWLSLELCLHGGH